MRPLHCLRFSNSMGRAVWLPLLAFSALGFSALSPQAEARSATESLAAVPRLKSHANPEPSMALTSNKGSQPSPSISTTFVALNKPILVQNTAPTSAEDTGAEDTGAEDTGDEADTTEPSAGQLAPPTASPDETVTIPKASAIVVSFPAEVTLDPKRKHDVPITLKLVQPIVDSDGQIVAPAKSLATAKLKAMKGGDLIEVVSVVVGGRVIPINAIGTLVPAQNKPEDVANPVVGSPGLLNNTLTALQQSSALTNHFDFSGRNRLTTFDIIDLGLSLGVGLTQPVPVIPPAFVNIAQDTVYILTLASPVTVPKRLVETGIQILEKSEDLAAQ